MYRIDATRLIPGSGDPIDEATVVVEDGRITYAGTRAGAPEITVTHSVDTLMPGMWDVHGHFFGVREARVEALLSTHPATAAVRSSRDALAALMAGFTSVREVGGYGVFLAEAIAEGTIVGPNIYGAGDVLSTTGGHGDIHAFPLDVVHQLLEAKISSGICDGVPECLKAVRKQLRLNAKVIKICASGGVMSEVDHPIHQQFSDEELRAIVDEAARAERVVAAHCHGKPGMMAALRAGVKTIEHGTYLDEEVAELMLEKDAILVPTRWIIEQLNASGPTMNMPDYAYQKLIAMVDQHASAMKIAIQSGVKIATGTDIFISGAGFWGTNGRELVHLVDAGMSPLSAIEAATVHGAETVGPQAPRTGRIEAGYEADVIVVAGNPLDDISLLANPSAVTHVWKGGELVKSPAA